MSHLVDDTPVTSELGDVFAIDYSILPEAKREQKPRRSLWEIFLIGWEAFTPRIPGSSGATVIHDRPRG